jgi:hypothetical protein
VFLDIAKEEEEEERLWMLSQNSSLPMPPLSWIRVVVLGGGHKSISRMLCCLCFRVHVLSCNDDIYHSLFCFPEAFFITEYISCIWFPEF